MNNCKNCEHAIFDEKWGELKCKVKCRRIYEALKSKYTCDKWKEKKSDGKQSTMADKP